AVSRGAVVKFDPAEQAGPACRHASSAPEMVRRGAAPSFSFSLKNEGAERRLALRLSLAPLGGAACRVTGTRASRRSTGSVSPLGPLFRETGRTSFHFAPIQAGQPAPPFIRSASSHLRQPPSCDGHGRWSETTRTLVCVDQRPGRHTLLRSMNAS